MEMESPVCPCAEAAEAGGITVTESSVEARGFMVKVPVSDNWKVMEEESRYVAVPRTFPSSLVTSRMGVSSADFQGIVIVMEGRFTSGTPSMESISKIRFSAGAVSSARNRDCSDMPENSPASDGNSKRILCFVITIGLPGFISSSL